MLAPLRPVGLGIRPIPGPNPLAEAALLRLLADHRALHTLCDALESVADTLPDLTKDAAALQLCRELALTHAAHGARAARFMAESFADARQSPLGGLLLGQIADRHTADSLHFQDLIAALATRGAAPETPGAAPETLAYMLRCGFDGCRRAMNFEVLALLTLGRDRLSDHGRALLIEGLRSRTRV